MNVEQELNYLGQMLTATKPTDVDRLDAIVARINKCKRSPISRVDDGK